MRIWVLVALLALASLIGAYFLFAADDNFDQVLPRKDGWRFGVYRLTESPMGQSKIAVTDKAGKTWYRDDNPGITASCIVLESAHVLTSNIPSRFDVEVLVHDACRDQVARWAGSNLGAYVGLVDEDRVLSASKLSSSVKDFFWFGQFETEAEAQRYAQRLIDRAE